MGLLKSIGHHFLAVLMGYDRLITQMKYIEENARKSDQYVEARLLVINGEMGRIDKSLASMREDLAYIRGKFDK